MSQRGNQSFQQGANMSRQAAGTAARAGKTAYRAGKKVSKYIPPKVKLVIAGVLIVVIILEVLVGGSSSTSMDETWYLTAENETVANEPVSEEELTSVETEEQSVKKTESFMCISIF